jgi:hypothetical protein
LAVISSTTKTLMGQVRGVRYRVWEEGMVLYSLRVAVF